MYDINFLTIYMKYLFHCTVFIYFKSRIQVTFVSMIVYVYTTFLHYSVFQTSVIHG